MTVYLGRYEVVREVGRGGMATVYLGTDRVLGRSVAIKVLHPHLLTQQDARTRFAREARVIARLKHPGIVEVYDFSEADSDQVVLVAEFVDGEALSSFFRRHGPMTPEMAALVVATVADAVAHAHQRGVIHRDIKPENVMVRRDGALKLMDFGIAHVVDMEHLTVTGTILGSPAHMSPEQVDGGGLDARTDVFSLGTLFYLLATGKYPFEADSPTALLRAIAEARFPDPRRQRPGFPEDLCRVLLRMMARNPDERYADGGEARDALLEPLRALGFGPFSEEVPRYLLDPVLGEAQAGDRVAEMRTQRAREALRAGRPALAIQEASVALACRPDHPEAQGVVLRARKVASRRAWARRLGVGGIAVLGVGIVLTLGVALWTGGDFQGREMDVLAGAADAWMTEVPAETGPGGDPAWSPGEDGDLFSPKALDEPSGPAPGGPGTTASSGPSRAESRGRTTGTGRPGAPVLVPLSIQAYPPAVRIFVDGNLVGEGRVENLSLAPGRHRIRLHHPACAGCLDLEEEVVLDPRRPPPGPLRLSIRYRDAEVLVRGDPGGMVFVAGERVARGRVGTPVAIPMRQPGPVPVRLRVEWEDRPPKETSVSLEAGRLSSVDLP